MLSYQKQPQTDESYWLALLDEVESLPSSEFQQKAHSPIFSDVRIVPKIKSEIDDAWKEAQRLYENEEIIELQAWIVNRGGLLVKWRGIDGFIPSSQLSQFPQVTSDIERTYELRKRQYQPMKLRIIKVDQLNGRLIFSERAALVAAGQRNHLWEEIRVGDKRPGVITNVTQFGAFIDLGGVEGLIHISELSWSRLSHPNDVVRLDEKIDCIILDIDRHRHRVALSLKRLRPDPWYGVSDRYHVGQVVDGIIKNITQYGAFITLEDELEGLIHVTELMEGNAMHPGSIVEEGQRIRVRVLVVNPRERRIALTMRDV